MFKSTAEEYICNANDVIKFQMIREESDLNDDENKFGPSMSHQLFGDKEQIFGYKDLSVKILYSAAKLNIFVSINCGSKINPKDFDGINADKILPKLQKVLSNKYTDNLNEFSAMLKSEKEFKPHGEMIHQYKRESTDGIISTFEIYNCKITDNGFKDYHNKMETFLLWFIDGASFIDTDDDKWDYYVVFEKYHSDSKPAYAFVGYCTVYNFYAYPKNIRPRISQFLIIPPYQRKGHGIVLLETLYNCFLTRNEVVDITVEDPSVNFQCLRDFVDSRNCLKLKSFSKKSLQLGFSKSMVKESKAKFKINRYQARRIYEILRLKFTNLHNSTEFQDYKKSVVARLEIPFRTKISRVLGGSDASNLGILPSGDEKLDILERQFEEALNDYIPVVKKLDQIC